MAPPGADQRNPHSSHMSDKLPDCLSVFLSLCLSVCLPLSACLSVCQVLFPPFWLTCRCCFPARRISDRVAPHSSSPSPSNTTVCWLLLSLIMILLCMRVCTRFLSCCYCCSTTMRFHSRLSSCLFVRVTLLSSGVRACLCVCASCHM